MLTNGGALAACFDVHDSDDAAHWMLARNHFGPFEFIRLLFTSPAFGEALPEMTPVDPSPLRWQTHPRPEPDPSLAETSSLLLDGQLAAVLSEGGVYDRFDRPAAEAKDIAVAAVAEIVGRRYEDFRVDKGRAAWSSWFKNFIFDATWVITDRRLHTITVICTTDID